MYKPPASAEFRALASSDVDDTDLDLAGSVAVDGS